MTLFVCSVVYAGVLVFIVASAARAVRFARMPLHLRWEIYPVPHGRLETVKAMFVEIVFLKGLWGSNRPLWFRSFPFHFGIYLLASAIALVVGRALVELVAPIVTGSSFALLMHALSAVVAVAGWILVTLGAIALLHRRLTDRSIRAYTVPADVFNLVAFVAALGTIGAGVLVDRGPGVRSIAAGILTFDRSVSIPPLLGVGLVLGALLVAYIPLTHMAHFVAKYFTYHAVRWDDEASIRGGQMEGRIAECLTYQPTWAARHVGADGAKDWVAVATSSPNEGAGK